MYEFIDLLVEILNAGTRKPTRAKLLSTGENVHALSLFGRQIRFDLSAGFPLLTEKKVSFYQIAHELIWFLKGSTNIKYLVDRNIHIWDQWADEHGELGPVYGRQWRAWDTIDGQKIDQIQKLIDGIKETIQNPTASVGRRLIVTAWNPAEIDSMALPPCHCLAQFSVSMDKKLSCQLYQRSADSFLGVPYNIASYALLTHVIAHLTGLLPGEFIHTFGDVHIYENHLDQINEMIAREPYPLPTLQIDPELTNIDQLEFKHLKLHGYQHHPALKGEVAV